MRAEHDTVPDDDAADVKAAAAGDVPAFERLYRRHVARVHGVVWRLAGGVQARADDLVQETFLRAWRHLDSFRGGSRFSTWLHRLAVNTALMDLRSARSRPDIGAGPAGDEAHHTDDPGQQMDLQRAVSSLPPRARAVLVLHDIEGWQHREIAAELDMAVGTSKAQLHRARQLLRHRLEGHGHAS